VFSPCRLEVTTFLRSCCPTKIFSWLPVLLPDESRTYITPPNTVCPAFPSPLLEYVKSNSFRRQPSCLSRLTQERFSMLLLFSLPPARAPFFFQVLSTCFFNAFLAFWTLLLIFFLRLQSCPSPFLFKWGPFPSQY